MKIPSGWFQLSGHPGLSSFVDTGESQKRLVLFFL